MDRLYLYYHEHSLGTNGKVDQVTFPLLEVTKEGPTPTKGQSAWSAIMACDRLFNWFNVSKKM